MADGIDTLVTGATVIDADGRREASVAIREGRILALLPRGEAAQARLVIDAPGRVLLPGLVDVHAHLREPGLTHKEDFASGTHAAALGGVTTVLDMPTDEPWTATPDQLRDKIALARGRIHVDVGFQVVLRRSLEDLEALAALGPVSFELFTADVPEPFLFATMDDVAEALRRLAPLGVTVGVSPGDQSILAASAGRDTSGSIAAFGASRPPLAEASGVARAVLAAAATGARVHVRQVNSSLGTETWRRLRDLANASVETTPQNLFFTVADYERHGAALKASPPLREAADVTALRAALRDGLIDVVGTDHAPHAPDEKARATPAFADIPGGLPGLQTLLPTMLRLVADGVVDLPDIARLCADTPSRRFGLAGRKGRIAPGHDADILMLDMSRPSTIRTEDQASKAGATPFHGWTVPGTLERVLLRGHVIVEQGVLVLPARGAPLLSHP